MSNKYYFFNVKTQFENVGDGLINRELIHEAANHGDVFVDLSRCPNYFKDMLSIDSNITETKGLLHTLLKIFILRLNNKKVFYFLNPGGLGQRLSISSKFSSLTYTFILAILNLTGVKIVHVGMSYSKMNKIDLYVAKVRNKFLYKVFPRDKSSYDLLKYNGFNVTGIYPDLAFLANPLVSMAKSGPIVFSFRNDAEYAGSESFYKDVIFKVMSENENNKFIFYSQVQRDDAFMSSLYKIYSSNENVQLILCESNIQDSIDMFRKCHFSFSNRLHVLLLGWSNGCIPVPCLLDGQGGKINSIFSDIGLEDFILKDVNSFDFLVNLESERLVKSFNSQNENVKKMFECEF